MSVDGVSGSGGLVTDRGGSGMLEVVEDGRGAAAMLTEDEEEPPAEAGSALASGVAEAVRRSNWSG